MIIINVGDKSLDLYEDTNITWSWTAFRFKDKLSDQYTNNFTIPKTDNNIKILGIYSLLDYPNVQFGERIEPATLILNGVSIDIFIRISNITDEEIEISVFEDGFSSLDKNKLINDYLEDDHTTILEWNKWSMTNYPNKFVSYNYGMPYYWQLAQRHPYLKLKEDIIDKIDLQGYSIQNWNWNWNILCTKKVVCPQNTVQVLEMTAFDETLDNNLLTVKGGQHVTNDASLSGSQSVIFNRDCYSSMRIYFAWTQKPNKAPQTLYLKINDVSMKIIFTTVRTSRTPLHNFGYVDFSYNFHKDDKLTFYCDGTNNLNSCSLVVRMNISAYEITEDDYNIELEYKDRLPRLAYMWFNPYMVLETQYIDMDGGLHQYLQTERLSFAYFGQYCNIPQIKLGDLFYSLQWLIGGKLKENKYPKEIYFDTNEIYYPKNNRSEEKYLKEINSINPTSSKIGQKNYIKYKDDENPIPITTVNNSWLEYEKTFHEIVFHHFTDNVIKQYSMEPKQNIDYLNISTLTDVFDVKFNNIENPVIFNYNNRVEPIPIKHFDMNNLWYSKEVEMTFYGTPIDFRNYDTLFIDGRTYYVIDGEIDLNNNISKVNSVLVQWDVPTIQITNIYPGENDGDVYLEVNINSLLPLKDAYIEYQQGFNISTLKKQQLQLQTGTQTVKITGLEPRTYIFTPVVQNVQSINRGNSRNYTVRWKLPYVNIIELKKISSTEVSCKVEVISQASLTNVEDSFYTIGNPGVKRHSGKLLPINGIQTFTYGLSTDTWYCYVEATNVNGTTKSTTKQITL